MMIDFLFALTWVGFSFYIPTLIYLSFRQQEMNRFLVEQMREERRMIEAETAQHKLIGAETLDQMIARNKGHVSG